MTRDEKDKKIAELLTAFSKIFGHPTKPELIGALLREVFFGTIGHELDEKFGSLVDLDEADRIYIITGFITKVREKSEPNQHFIIQSRKISSYMLSTRLVAIGQLIWGTADTPPLPATEAAKELNKLLLAKAEARPVRPSATAAAIEVDRRRVVDAFMAAISDTVNMLTITNLKRAMSNWGEFKAEFQATTAASAQRMIDIMPAIGALSPQDKHEAIKAIIENIRKSSGTGVGSLINTIVSIRSDDFASHELEICKIIWGGSGITGISYREIDQAATTAFYNDLCTILGVRPDVGRRPGQRRF